jgi:eukaryotic-like serine/threonine-protein kinase
MSKQLTAEYELSHYRIVSKIGAGGMGEVYRAHDSRLDRDVAIKMLPADFANDEDRLRRFEQEAKATSALNHPNIITVYDIGGHEGSPFIVSELLDGQELRDRLDEGAIPLRKTIDYAQQIVNGLSAAHEKGITHRDLKPENLFITKDGRVKILDFGLAKLSERGKNIQGSEDATKKALTDPGVVMGTVGYMSPEQVKGISVDHRSDIFSFGVILYEMLTGRRAFDGDSVVETMHSILKDDVPELEDTSEVRIPPALNKLMRRCVEKKPEDRFHSAHDLGFALDAVASPTNSSGSGPATSAAEAVAGTRRSTWLGRAAWAAAGLFLISTVFLSTSYFRRTPIDRQTMRFSISPPEKHTFSESFALSPDGQQIAFVALGAVGGTSLWLLPLTSVEPRQLAGTEGASFPFWSPDSRTIGFFAGGKLRKIEVSGGPTQTLADVSGDPRGGTWTPDGTIIFAPITTSPLMRVSASGGPASELTKLDAELGQTSHRWPSMLPDGRHFLYFGRGSRPDKQGIYVTSIDSPESKFLIATPLAGAYTESDGTGYILFIRESALMVQRFDPGDLSLSGEPALLAQGVLFFPGEIGPTAYSAFSASAGRLIYRTGDQQTTRLTWFDRSGKSLGSISEPGGHHEPSLSKDGTKVLFGRSEGSDRQDIYLQDLSRGSTTRLTFDRATDATSVFSPDESQIVFHSERTGTGGIYRKSSSGAGDEELLKDSEDRIAYPDSWSRDGKYLLFMKGGGAKTKIDLWVLPMTGDPTPFPYLVTQFLETHAQFSPDGRWVAYTSDESGRAEVYIQSFPIGAGKWQISTAGGDQSQWRSDGKELFYLAADRSVMAVSIGGSGTLEIGRPTALFQAAVPLAGIADSRNDYVPTQDGQRFLVNMLADTTNSQPLTFVLNWAADLKK